MDDEITRPDLGPEEAASSSGDPAADALAVLRERRVPEERRERVAAALKDHLAGSPERADALLPELRELLDAERTPTVFAQLARIVNEAKLRSVLPGRSSSSDGDSPEEALARLRAALADRAPSPAAAPAPAEAGDRFVLLEPLGCGAGGRVHRALWGPDQREVAVKLLHEHHADNPRLLERFRREAEALEKLRHPRILELIDAGLRDGRWMIVTELVPGGRTLAHAVRDGCSAEELLTYLRDAIEALAVVHEAGLVHRDVKPSNIFVFPDGRAKLGDFGLVVDPSRPRLTEHGATFGTPGYIPPEGRESARDATPAWDVWAWGETAAWCLATSRVAALERWPSVAAAVAEARTAEAPRRPAATKLAGVLLAARG